MLKFQSRIPLTDAARVLPSGLNANDIGHQASNVRLQFRVATSHALMVSLLPEASVLLAICAERQRVIVKAILGKGNALAAVQAPKRDGAFGCRGQHLAVWAEH